jgi:hypothetical protein
VHASGIIVPASVIFVTLASLPPRLLLLTCRGGASIAFPRLIVQSAVVVRYAAFSAGCLGTVLTCARAGGRLASTSASWSGAPSTGRRLRVESCAVGWMIPLRLPVMGLAVASVGVFVVARGEVLGAVVALLLRTPVRWHRL